MGRVEVHPKDESGIDLITALPQTIRIYILRGEEEKKMLPRWEEERKNINFVRNLCEKREKILMCEKKRQNRTSMLFIPNK